MTIWLTEADRAAYMEALRTTKPDLDLVPYLEELNAIPGVCTVMSCAGWHPQEDRTTFTMGYVTLHLSEKKARVIEKAGNDLTSFCAGYAAGLVKEWNFAAHRSLPDIPCLECEPLHRRGCRVVVQHTVSFSGRVWMACLRALIGLLGEPCRR